MLLQIYKKHTHINLNLTTWIRIEHKIKPNISFGWIQVFNTLEQWNRDDNGVPKVELSKLCRVTNPKVQKKHAWCVIMDVFEKTKTREDKSNVYNLFYMWNKLFNSLSTVTIIRFWIRVDCTVRIVCNNNQQQMNLSITCCKLRVSVRCIYMCMQSAKERHDYVDRYGTMDDVQLVVTLILTSKYVRYKK